VARPGDALMSDCGGSCASGAFGEAMALAAQLRGIAGIVIDGAVRGSAIAAAGVPVFPDVLGALAAAAAVLIASLADTAALRAAMPGLAPGPRGRLAIAMPTLLASDRQALAVHEAAVARGFDGASVARMSPGAGI